MTRIRELVGDVPIMATIDPHANLSQKMIAAVDAMIAYRTNPHLDQRVVGRQASDLMVKTLRGDCKPTMAAAYPPIAINIERQNTDEEPCLSLYKLANDILEDKSVLSDSVVLGFPYTDTEEMGSSFIVVTDNDHDAAQRHADSLANYLVEHRSDFAGKFINVDDALKKVTSSEKPVCLLDMGDNVGGGSAADSTILARALNDAGIRSYVCIYDPESVVTAKAAGVGATLDLEIGAKTDDLHGDPLAVSVTVRGIYDGKYTESEVRHGGRSEYDMGDTVIVETGNGLCVSLTTRRVVPFSLGMVLSCDLDPAEFDVLVAKGVVAPVAAFAPVCPTLIRVNTKGSTSADMTNFEFHHRRRPMYPFENI
jgi:microcystin degradation protein MlrC